MSRIRRKYPNRYYPPSASRHYLGKEYLGKLIDDLEENKVNLRYAVSNARRWFKDGVDANLGNFEETYLESLYGQGCLQSETEWVSDSRRLAAVAKHAEMLALFLAHGLAPTSAMFRQVLKDDLLPQLRMLLEAGGANVLLNREEWGWKYACTRYPPSPAALKLLLQFGVGPSIDDILRGLLHRLAGHTDDELYFEL